MKIHNGRNHIYGENFKLKLCMCAQSMALGTRTKLPLEILIRSTISAIHKFWKNILESSLNVSETTARSPASRSPAPRSPVNTFRSPASTSWRTFFRPPASTSRATWSPTLRSPGFRSPAFRSPTSIWPASTCRQPDSKTPDFAAASKDQQFPVPDPHITELKALPPQLPNLPPLCQ